MVVNEKYIFFYSTWASTGKNLPDGSVEQQGPHQTPGAVRQALSFSAKELIMKVKINKGLEWIYAHYILETEGQVDSEMK